jgi:hypothetical protein
MEAIVEKYNRFTSSIKGRVLRTKSVMKVELQWKGVLKVELQWKSAMKVELQWRKVSVSPKCISMWAILFLFVERCADPAYAAASSRTTHPPGPQDY